MNVDSCDDCKKQGTSKCNNKPHHWCSDHVKKRVCPLPRIGSKDWNWTWNDRRQWYYTAHLRGCGYLIIGTSDGWIVFVMSSEAPPIFRIVFGEKLSLQDAKVLAEARIRRDWKDRKHD